MSIVNGDIHLHSGKTRNIDPNVNAVSSRRSSTYTTRYFKGKRESAQPTTSIKLPRITTTYERAPVDHPVREGNLNLSGFGGNTFKSSKLQNSYAQQESLFDLSMSL